MNGGSNIAALRHVVAKFRIAVFLYWSLSSAFLSYYVLFLETRKHLPATDIGMMMSLFTVSAIAGQYAFGFLCDKTNSIKTIYVVGSLLVGIAILSFPLYSSRICLYGAMALIGFLQQPLGPVIDSWVLKHLSKYGSERFFGRIRGFGSIGWASTALVTALLIQNVSWLAMFYVCGAASVLLVVTVSLIPDIRLNDCGQSSAAGAGGQVKAITQLEAIKELVRDKQYMFIIAVMFWLFLGEQTSYNYLGLLVKGAGGSVVTLGLTYFLGSGSEMPSMFLSVALLKRFAARTLMGVAMVIYIARFVVILYFRTPLSITLASMLEGLAFGLLFTSFRNYVYAVAPERLQTMALTIGDAVFLSFTVIIGGAVGGVLIDNVGVFNMMTCCMISCIIALFMLICGAGRAAPQASVAHR